MWASGELVTLRYRSLDGRFHEGHPVRVIEHTPAAEFFQSPQSQEARRFVAGELLV